MNRAEPIRGKVAQILNSRDLALNIGEENGVTLGMIFDIVDPKGDQVRDPDTGEVLGSLDRPKVRVRISAVHPRLSVASTYKSRKVNVGGVGAVGGLAGIGDFSRLFRPPEIVVKYETLKTTEKTWETLDESHSYVKIGDPVVQVMRPDPDDAPTPPTTPAVSP